MRVVSPGRFGGRYVPPGVRLLCGHRSAPRPCSRRARVWRSGQTVPFRIAEIVVWSTPVSRFACRRLMPFKAARRLTATCRAVSTSGMGLGVFGQPSVRSAGRERWGRGTRPG